MRGHASDLTARTLALDLLEGSRLGGLDEAELDSVSDRVPLVAELVRAAADTTWGCAARCSCPDVGPPRSCA